MRSAKIICNYEDPAINKSRVWGDSAPRLDLGRCPGMGGYPCPPDGLRRVDQGSPLGVEAPRRPKTGHYDPSVVDVPWCRGYLVKKID